MNPLRLILLVALLSCPYLFADDPIRPKQQLTPGAVFPEVTVDQICTPGYANGSDSSNNGHGVRYVPRSVKWKVFKSYFGNVPDATGNYEVDHLISLELGDNNDAQNLWPQKLPYRPLQRTC